MAQVRCRGVLSLSGCLRIFRPAPLEAAPERPVVGRAGRKAVRSGGVFTDLCTRRYETAETGRAQRRRLVGPGGRGALRAPHG